MKSRVLLLCSICAFWLGCGNPEQEGRLAAQRAAEEAAKREAASGSPLVKRRAPVPDSRKVDCAQLVNPVLFSQALDEKEQVVVRDVRKATADASAACSLVRGGTPLTPKQQEALIKRNGKLGVLPGDELCHIAAFCSVAADEELLRRRCTGKRDKADDTIGQYACVTTREQGPVDVISVRAVDPDTHCLLEVRGGPSVADHDFIRRCAKAAIDLIGPNEISEVPAASEAPTPAASGEAPAAPAP